MAFTVDLINTSPRGDVALYVDDQQCEVPAGGTLTVTPETAGEAPHWRRGDDQDEAALQVNPEALHWRIRAGQLEVFDLGSGLLSQVENWRKAGDDTDPADPNADGHGGTIDHGVPGAAGQALAEFLRARDEPPADQARATTSRPSTPATPEETS